MDRPACESPSRTGSCSFSRSRVTAPEAAARAGAEFSCRARVTSPAASRPGEQANFTFRLGPAHSATSGGVWSGVDDVRPAAGRSPLKVTPRSTERLPRRHRPDARRRDGADGVEAEMKLVRVERWSRWRRAVRPRWASSSGATTGNEKPRRAPSTPAYWKQLEGVHIPESKRPKKFPWSTASSPATTTAANGATASSPLPRRLLRDHAAPSKPVREIARELGVTKTAWAVYSPPGYAFDWRTLPTRSPRAAGEWARQQAKPYTTPAGRPRRVAPSPSPTSPAGTPRTLKAAEDPAVLKRFHAYLQVQGLEPATSGPLRGTR